MSRLTRRQLAKGAAAAGALMAAGRLGVAAAQSAPETVALARPIRGRVLPGRTVQYFFEYPGDQSVYTAEMHIMPDSAGARAGFRIYRPDGTTQVIGGFQGGLSPNVSANVISRTPGMYLLQVYNDNPGVAVDYWVRVLAGREEGKTVPAVTNIAQAAATPMIAYVGGYTGAGGGMQRPEAERKYAEGIKVYRMDPATGNLTQIQSYQTIGNPSFLAVDPSQRFLVAIHGGNFSRVSSHAIDRDGRLAFINDQSSNGTNPVYPVISPDSRWVLIACYTGATISAYPIDESGRIGEATDTVKHAGQRGPHQNQDAPHPHQIIWDPDFGYVFVPDLGLDKVFSYAFRPDTGKFTPNGFAELPAGSGPRQIAFHQTMPFAYGINELNSTLAVFSYDRGQGVLHPVQIISSIPDPKASSAGAEIEVAPSGQHVYVSNRWTDTIGVFAIDQTTGMVSPVDWTPTGARTPRHFAIDPTGSYLYAEGLDSDNITTFAVDQATGKLTFTGQSVQTNSPSCMVFGKV